MTDRRVAVHLTLSDFRFQSRTFRMIEALLDARVVDEFRVFSLAGDGLPAEETTFGGRVHLRRIDVRLPWKVPGLLRHGFQYLAWCAVVVARSWRLRPLFVQAKSFEVLPLARVLSALHRCPLVYDAAELESEKGHPRFPRIRAFGTRLLERSVIGAASLVMVVSDSIADWYRGRYRIVRPLIVRNVPAMRSVPLVGQGRLRSALGISAEAIVFLYQGVLTQGRGIRRLLRAAEALRATSDERYVVFLGYGPYEKEIREAAARNPRVRWIPAVPPDEVLQYSVDADLGLVLIEGTCLSYTYSLPNKLFEHYLSGVPVIVSNLPELRRFVESRRAGFVAPDDDGKLAEFLSSVSRAELEKLRANLRVDPTIDSWEAEARGMVRAYRQLLVGAT